MAPTPVFATPEAKDLNPAWTTLAAKTDPWIERHHAYWLSGPSICPTVRCSAAKCSRRSPEAVFYHVETAQTVFEPMLLCLTCNRASHVKCNELTLESFREEMLPWRCTDCKADIHNQHATAYLQASQYTALLKERRKAFLRPEKASDDRSFQSDDPFDDDDAPAFEPEHDAWTVRKTADDVARLEMRNRQMQREMDALRKQLEEALKLIESRPAKTQPHSTAYGADASSFNFTHYYSAAQEARSESAPLRPSQTTSKAKVQPDSAAHTTPSFDFTRCNVPPRPSQAPSTSKADASKSNTSQEDVSTLFATFTQTQQQLLDERLLSQRRKMASKISDFDGDPSKYLEFAKDVERYRTELKYDDATIKYHLRGALKGDAYDGVKGTFDLMSLDQLLEDLKSDYGDPMLVVQRSEKPLKDFKVKGDFYREDALKLRQLIRGYFSACLYADVGYLNSNALADVIYKQFRQDVRIKIREHFIAKRKSEDEVLVINLKLLHDFLTSYIPLLDSKSLHHGDKREESKGKSQQVNFTASTVSPAPSEKGAWKFQLLSKNTDPRLGYDMTKVNEIKRYCQICNRNGHYPLTCNNFKAMSAEQRLNTVTEKKLCLNCLLTNAHQANACEMKSACGYKLKGSANCQSKHHAALHTSFVPRTGKQGGNRRPNKGNTNRNTERARNAMTDAKDNNGVGSVSIDNAHNNEPTPSTSAVHFHSQNLRQYVVKDAYTGIIQVNLHSATDYQKTVKMIRHDFIGPKGATTAYSVGDSGAEVTLVRDDLRVALGLEGTPHVLSLSWADESTKLCNAIKFNLTVRGVHPGAKPIVLKDCYAIADLNLPTRSLDMNLMVKRFPYLRGIAFETYRNEQPVMLIGTTHASVAENIGRIRRGRSDDPIGIECALGFSVYGGNPHSTGSEQLAAYAIAENDDTDSDDHNSNDESLETSSRVSNDDLSILYKRFNAIESIGILPAGQHLIAEERKAVEILKEEMRVLDSGSIEVPLIWNRDANKQLPKLPNNFALAYRRQTALEKKLAKNPTHLRAYNANVKELLELRYLRRASPADLEGEWPNVWYLPTNLVVNANKNPPKMRNVYDARATCKGQSLNDALLKGPDLLIGLATPLLRARLNRIAVSADVKQMFHQLHLCLRDQQCQRILWREDPESSMETLILSVMAFGPKCSPFVSQFVKNWNADRWMESYPEAAQMAKSSVYMDDVLVSLPTVDKATQIAKQLIAIFKSMNWELVSFQSNSRDFLRTLPETHVKKDLIPLLEDEDTEHVTKILGCSWSTTEDAFIFELDKNIFVTLMTEFEHKPTKKDLASLIARIFDVLGFIAHYVIRGKILLQRTWKLKIGWDEEAPEEVLSEWKAWLSDIQDIANLKIPRMISDIDAIAQADKIELHVFCDAGVEAFGAAAYLVVHSHNQATASLIMAKAKVTPLRFHTETEVKEIPRLELMSALIASRLSKTIIDAYEDINMEKFFWSDSEIVLRWIINPNQRLLKYAVGPIEEILENSKRSDWRYVPSMLNPADTCTKFKNFDFSDSKSPWFTGPDFITKGRDAWPPLPEKLIAKEHALVYSIHSPRLNYSSHQLPPHELDEFIDRLSAATQADWGKLRRSVARSLKIFMDGLVPALKACKFNDKSFRKELKKRNLGFKFLTPTDLERAEHFIFRKLQREGFPAEYQALLTGKPVRNKLFRRLNVFMDEQRLLRINSRVNLNEISFPQQFAPLLPRTIETTYRLLEYYHRQYNHIALESQLAEIRTRCWIDRLRQTLRVTKQRCHECKLREKQLYQPPMAPLPDFRINPAQRPFQVVALDCFGPYMVNCGGRYKKVWVLIFTCTLSRFVHLHLLESLESIKVLEAIVVFWAAHGPVATFVSDNGTNFVGAAKALKEDLESARVILSKQQANLATNLAEKYAIEWQFIPPHAPWMGGVYERLIKEVKRALYGILNQKKIHKTALNIAIHETSHRLNLRPLTYNSIDSEDSKVLTPYLVAKGVDGYPLLPGLHKGSYANVSDKDVYRQGRAVADQIMAKFTANYLPEYTRRAKWYTDKRDVRKNDIVMIVDPRNTRSAWTRGRIVKVRPSRDGRGRKADVLLPDGRIKLAAVRNLARLDLSCDPKSSN